MTWNWIKHSSWLATRRPVVGHQSMDLTRQTRRSYQTQWSWSENSVYGCSNSTCCGNTRSVCCLGLGRVLSKCVTASLREQLHVCLSLKWPTAFDNEKLGLPVIRKDKEALNVSGRYLSRMVTHRCWRVSPSQKSLSHQRESSVSYVPCNIAL